MGSCVSCTVFFLLNRDLLNRELLNRNYSTATLVIGDCGCCWRLWLLLVVGDCWGLWLLLVIVVGGDW